MSENCTGNCARSLLDSLYERQDMRNILASTDASDLAHALASVNFRQDLFDSWLKVGGTISDLCLFVLHQLLHAYSYSDVTVVGIVANNAEASFSPYVTFHQKLDRKLSILQHASSGQQNLAHFDSCCLHDPMTFDTVFRYRAGKREAIPYDHFLNIVIEDYCGEVEFKFYVSPSKGQTARSRGIVVNDLVVTTEFLMTQILKDPTMQLLDLEYIPHNLPNPVTSTSVAIPENLVNMVDMFSEQVRKYPIKIGLIVPTRKFTFAEMDYRSNVIANFILQSQCHTNSGSVIGVCLERSELLIFAILGIWKTGGVYVPIDPNTPTSRILTILSDCQPQLILTDFSSISKLPSEFSGPILDISSINLEEVAVLAPPKFKEATVALIIYTSGTTGKPKGVMIGHSNLVNQCLDYPRRYPDMGQDEIIVQMFNYAFNAFLEPITLSWSMGLTLVLVPFSLIIDPIGLVKCFVEHGVTHIDGTPSLSTQYNFGPLKTLRRVVVGGEPLTSEHCQILERSNPGIRIYNVYGNTEGSLCSMTQEVPSTGQAESGFGRLVVNKSIYLLTSELKCVPLGGIGEICLAGQGVTMGYLGNESLTKEKYVLNPFRNDSEAFERLYRTGDLGIQNKFGKVEIVGRKDNQVKIRGIRVEISEIEEILLQIPEVKKAVVLLSNQIQGSQLIGFITANQVTLESEIKSILKLRLPEYMIPTRIFQIPEFPLTPNGKVNRIQLQEGLSYFIRNDSEVKTNNRQDSAHSLSDIIGTVKTIWAEALELPSEADIEETSNFFELGGNSLLLIKVLADIDAKLGLHLSGSRIFASGGNFQDFLVTDDAEQEPSIVPSERVIPLVTERASNIPLSSAQERILLNPNHPNNHNHFEFEILGDILAEKERLLRKIAQVIEDNEILRTIYPISKFGVRVQKILLRAELNLDLATIVLRDDASWKTGIEEFIRKPFDLKNEIPIRFALFELKLSECSRNHMIIVVHSVAMDVDSQNIFLTALLSARIPSATQYADFAAFQRSFQHNDAHVFADYWKTILRSCPWDKVSILSRNKDPLTQFKMHFPEHITNRLKDLSGRLGCSLFSILLTVHILCICWIEDDYLVDAESFKIATGIQISLRGHVSELANTMGNFGQLIPFSLEFKREDTLVSVFEEVAKKLREVESHQLFPLDLIQRAVSGIRQMQKLNVFQYVFDMRTASDSKEEGDIGKCTLRLRHVEPAAFILPQTQITNLIEIKNEENISMNFFAIRSSANNFKELRRGNIFASLLIKICEFEADLNVGDVFNLTQAH